MAKIPLIDTFETLESTDESNGQKALWELYDPSVDQKTDSIVDGKYILGRVRGPFFQPNGTSRNKRFYSKALWEKAIARTAKAVIDRSMMGTIGHEGKLDDVALRNGEGSHYLTKLWIDPTTGIGMGEALIIGTTAGQNLNAYLRSGFKLAVSSRAQGEYKGKDSSGNNIVDEDSFALEGFDFVRNPGIATAFPSLVESRTNETPNPNRENNMSDQALIESLSAAKGKLQTDLDEAVGEIASLKTQNQAVGQSLELKTQEVTNLTESLNEAKGQLDILEQYKALGTPAELAKSLQLAERLLTSYKAHGTPAEIGEALTRTTATLEAYAELGTPAELGRALDFLEAYASVGTVEQVQESAEELGQYHEAATLEEIDRLSGIVENYLESGNPTQVAELKQTLEAYGELGTVEEVKSVLEHMTSYVELGTPAEITEALDRSQEFVQAQLKARKDESYKTIAKDYNVSTERVESLVEKFGSEEEAIQVLEELRGKDLGAGRFSLTNRYRATNENANAVSESHENQRDAGSLAATLMKNIAR